MIHKNFHSRRWGSSLPGLRTQDPQLGPPLTLAEIFWRTCLQSHFLEISPFSGQNTVILGGRGGPRFFFYWNHLATYNFSFALACTSFPHRFCCSLFCMVYPSPRSKYIFSCGPSSILSAFLLLHFFYVSSLIYPSMLSLPSHLNPLCNEAFELPMTK